MQRMGRPRLAGRWWTHGSAASCASPARRQSAGVPLLLGTVHSVELELSLGRHLFDAAASDGEGGLVIGRHGQVASEAKCSVPLGKLAFPARRGLVLVPGAGRDGKPVTPSKLGVRGPRS